MRAALLLIDLQRDYLDRPGLQPAEAALVPAAATLLENFRAAGRPAFHVQTRVAPDGSDRMPHWRVQNRMQCVDGTPGAAPPSVLAPRDGETVIPKPFFSGFDTAALDAALTAAGADTVVIAGIYTHACVRSTALDAYRLGYRVLVAREAVASTEPEHARLTLEYLQGRAAEVLTNSEILAHLRAPVVPAPPRVWTHRNPCRWDEVLDEVPLADAREVAAAATAMRAAAPAWERAPLKERRARLEQWAGALETRRDALVAALVRDVAKPLRDARAEVDYALALLRHTIAALRPEALVQRGAGFECTQRALGTVALITPWNNPLAIPVGKLAPALGYGNTVVWKPALPTAAVTALVDSTLRESGFDRALRVLRGDAHAGRLLAEHAAVDAVSLTGGLPAGRALAAICARDGKPLQAELGGNNAVLVLGDVDVEATARALAPAIFSFAGQRCTAPRRIIVARAIQPRFERALADAANALVLGDPAREDTQVGPVISREQQARIAALAEQGAAAGGRLLCGGAAPRGLDAGCWFAPTLIADPPPSLALVREESFGPIAVVQGAENLDAALALCNAVPHGLVATLISSDQAAQRRFLAEARAGILALNRAPVAIAPDAAFAGWGVSGRGAPEHGRWDLEFYTRAQTRYGAAPARDA